MKTPILHLPPLVTGVAVLALAAAGAGAAPPAAVTPYTFLGRVMDSTHAAFDANRVCTLSANDAASGKLLAKTETFYRSDSRRNYALKVPVSTEEAGGYATQGRLLAVSAVDDIGRTWSGVVLDPVCGEAAGVREVDIVLGSDANGDGIDDALYANLRAQWEASDYWEYGAEFDPFRDYDGDGVSTIQEAYAGTNPFDPEDTLRITAFATVPEGASSGGLGAAADEGESPRPFALSFPSVPSRCYSIVTTTNLAEEAWSPAVFSLDPSAEPAVNVLSIPSNSGAGISTVYLLPDPDAPAAFFRVEAE